MTQVKRLLIAVGGALLGACAAGPNYQRVPVDMPVNWKIEPPWRESAPNDLADKGPWWLRFGDPYLDKLEQQALAANQTLAAATARLTRGAPRPSAPTAARWRGRPGSLRDSVVPHVAGAVRSCA